MDPAILAAIGQKTKNTNVQVWGGTGTDKKPETFFFDLTTVIAFGLFVFIPWRQKIIFVNYLKKIS